MGLPGLCTSGETKPEQHEDRYERSQFHLPGASSPAKIRLFMPPRQLVRSGVVTKAMIRAISL
jgi:hypothetical protein